MIYSMSDSCVIRERVIREKLLDFRWDDSKENYVEH